MGVLRHMLPLLLGLASALAAEVPAFRDPALPEERRLDDLLGRLSLEEKVALCHADTYWTNPGVPRLGIPGLVVSDGPHGVHEERLSHGWASAGRSDDFVTDLPAGVALAATWNPALAESYGKVLGAEARVRGKDVILGPGINIARTPLFGRNFEFTGEDPYLASRIAVGYIRGVQTQGVAACIKHFAANNQEIGARDGISVEVSRRALHELYLPGFRAAVREAGVLTAMGAYNSVNGTFACENGYLLDELLRGAWGFDGLVMSDWGGSHTTQGSALHGIDLEMNGRPKRDYDRMNLGKPFQKEIEEGRIPLSMLDAKVRRILRVTMRLGLLNPEKVRPAGSLNTPEHRAAALRVAEQSIVLLRNDASLLPLDLASVASVAVIGGNALKKHSPPGGGLPGGGSSAVKPLHETTPLEALLTKLAPLATVTYAQGYGPDAAQATALRERAVTAAKAADLVLYVGGLDHTLETETKDRPDMKLPYGQSQLIPALLAANPRTVVVLVGGSAMDLNPWVDSAKTLVLAWYNGSEAGTALAETLLGENNPSGRLPITLGRRLEDYAPHAKSDRRNYPGVGGKVYYDEGVFVGYRHFDAAGLAPLFCFGHGLSYTSFAYENLKVSESPDKGVFSVECTVRNTGARDGLETVQLYVAPKAPRTPRPPRELKRFSKVLLKSGESAVVSFELAKADFAIFDEDADSWRVEGGPFIVEIGASSRDLRLSKEVSVDPAAKLTHGTGAD